MKVTRLPLSKGKPSKPGSLFNVIDHPELIGLCRGVIAYGSINRAEAEYIQRWLGERPNLLETWPASALHELSAQEEQELNSMLEEVVGDPVTLSLY